MKTQDRVLSLFVLAMMNVAAICSIKSWALDAEFGFASLFILTGITVVFFVPIALVSAELATGWPETGGIFCWVREAFGPQWGLLSIWYLWVANVPWYPTVLSFISGSIAFIFLPELANNKNYTICMILVLFWISTYVNLKGMKTSSWISSIGVVAGTIIPGGLIIILAIVWFIQGHPIEVKLGWDHLIPKINNLNEASLIAGILLSFSGMEMTAIHAQNVINPQKNYPKAILLASFLIILFSALGTMAIAFVVPHHEISLVSGSLDAFTHFFKAYHLESCIPILAFLIAIGAFGQMSTWVAGPSRGLRAAIKSAEVLHILHKENEQGMPVAIFILQAIIVSFLALLFLFMPTVSSSFWLLVVLAAQMYFIMYIIMFAAVIRLRYTQADVFRSYRIPGGKVGVWFVGILGMTSSFIALCMSFIPPAQIQTGNIWFYESFLIGGIVLSTLAPFLPLIFRRFKKRDS